jgi:hypothetical protein
MDAHGVKGVRMVKGHAKETPKRIKKLVDENAKKPSQNSIPNLILCPKAWTPKFSIVCKI